MVLMEPTDSPTKWVNDHVRSYVESNGANGHHWNGMEILLLTTRGRKSGKMRRTALIYGQDGDRYLVVASNGGSDDHPYWFTNLLADPEVTVQVGSDVFAAHGRPATPQEKPALWEKMATIFPTYNSYQKKAPRDIPVIILERSQPRS